MKTSDHCEVVSHDAVARKNAAKRKIRAALKSQVITELESAIQEGSTVMKASELSGYRLQLRELHKVSARAQLRTALHAESAEKLCQVIEQCSADLAESELSDARRSLARLKIRAASESNMTTELERAIEQSGAILESDELFEARRSLARCKLRVALDGNAIHELKDAIAEGCAFCPEPELSEARRSVAKLNIQEAHGREDIAELTTAIDQGSAILSPADLYGARQNLARARISVACRSTIAQELKSALEYSKDFLPESELSELRSKLLAARKDDARNQIAEWICRVSEVPLRSNAARLRFCIEQGSALNLESEIIHLATATLAEAELNLPPACVLCFDEDIDAQLMPCCGRQGSSCVTCHGCVSRLAKCPFCRRPIQ